MGAEKQIQQRIEHLKSLYKGRLLHRDCIHALTWDGNDEELDELRASLEIYKVFPIHRFKPEPTFEDRNRKRLVVRFMQSNQAKDFFKHKGMNYEDR